jgi:hypothetical protein
MNRVALRVFFALAILSLANAARASDPFPLIIQGQLKLVEAPPCTHCHLTLIGGAMTVTKPFGRNLQQKYGLVSQDFEGLKRAIMLAQTNGDDVDGDGVGDIAELIQGTDPNVPEGGVAEEDVRYGCYCSTSHAAPSTVGGALWLSALALSSWRRRGVRRSRDERKT